MRFRAIDHEQPPPVREAMRSTRLGARWSPRRSHSLLPSRPARVRLRPRLPQQARVRAHLDPSSGWSARSPGGPTHPAERSMLLQLRGGRPSHGSPPTCSPRPSSATSPITRPTDPLLTPAIRTFEHPAHGARSHASLRTRHRPRHPPLATPKRLNAVAAPARTFAVRQVNHTTLPAIPHRARHSARDRPACFTPATPSGDLQHRFVVARWMTSSIATSVCSTSSSIGSRNCPSRFRNSLIARLSARSLTSYVLFIVVAPCWGFCLPEPIGPGPPEPPLFFLPYQEPSTTVGQLPPVCLFSLTLVFSSKSPHRCWLLSISPVLGKVVTRVMTSST